MNICVLDLETSSFQANSGIILCAVIKTYGESTIKTYRADKYSNWKTNKSNNKSLVKDVINYLKNFDIIIWHNGEQFDKTFLTSQCVKYGLEPITRYVKSIDPCATARKHLRIGRNSLVSLIDFLDIPDKKTPIDYSHWLKASLDSNMNYIVDHCVADVISLEKVYKKVKCLIDKIDKRGSSF